MIEPIATVRDPVRGLLLVYRTESGRKCYCPITSRQNAAWKRWIKASRDLLAKESSPR